MEACRRLTVILVVLCMFFIKVSVGLYRAGPSSCCIERVRVFNRCCLLRVACLLPARPTSPTRSMQCEAPYLSDRWSSNARWQRGRSSPSIRCEGLLPACAAELLFACGANFHLTEKPKRTGNDSLQFQLCAVSPNSSVSLASVARS